MKRCYAVILLLAFMVGTLQPILPMIEYQLYEGSIIELFETNHSSKKLSKTKSCSKVKKDQQTTNEKKDLSLLDVNYYPLALQLATIVEPGVFRNASTLYLPTLSNKSSPTFFPNPPPPKWS